MDRTRSGRSWDSSTATGTPPTSSTSLSQDTDEILSSWHRFLDGCNPAEQRRAAQGATRLGYGTTLLPMSSRYAGLRHPPAFPQPEERPRLHWTPPSSSSSDYEGKDESDVSRVSLGWSVCYAVTVLLTALFALTTAVVLVQLIPASAASAPRREAPGAALVKGGALLKDGVRAAVRTTTQPAPKAKTPSGSSARTVRTGLLRAVSSATGTGTVSRNFISSTTRVEDKIEATTGGDVTDWQSSTVPAREPPSRESLEEAPLGYTMRETSFDSTSSVLTESRRDTCSAQKRRRAIRKCSVSRAKQGRLLGNVQEHWGQ